MSADDINVGPGIAANALRIVPADDIPAGTFLGTVEQIPYAMKVTVVGAVTYVAIAPIGTLQATAGWQCKRITVAGADTVVEWALGNASFVHVATDLTALVYA